MQEEIE